MEAGVLKKARHQHNCVCWQGRLRQAIATIQEGLVERDTEVRAHMAHWQHRNGHRHHYLKAKHRRSVCHLSCTDLLSGGALAYLQAGAATCRAAEHLELWKNLSLRLLCCQARLLLLAALSGEHILFIGPPGTAKSELGRRLSQLYKGNFFERLLTRFSVPEVSIVLIWQFVWMCVCQMSACCC